MQELLEECPYLASPAALARMDTNGKFLLPSHLARLNSELMDVPFTPNSRLIVNIPFQHGKTWLASHYYPAWRLLLWPETRLILIAHGDDYAATFGSKVKDVLLRWGEPHGISLKKDTKAKDEWVIKGHEGGMVCRGKGGTVTGRPADELLLDDLIRDAEEAMSPICMEKDWNWYQTVAYSRLGPTAGITAVGTRWGGRDIFGRILAEARQTGEQWKVVKFKAIAEKNDNLGRKEGEALWPERVPLDRLQMVQKARGKWFRSCWQQEPDEEEGAHFRSRTWPTYEDSGTYWLLESYTQRRDLVYKGECLTLVTADWANSKKAGADFTSIGAFALTPDGRLLVLEVLNVRVRIEECVPLLAKVCRRYRPQVVAVEAQSFQAALANECRRHGEIPEPRRLLVTGVANDKLRRALPAIIMGENDRILLPAPIPDESSDDRRKRLAGYVSGKEWLEEYVEQLAVFTGMDDAHDDMVDVTANAAMIVQEMRQPQREGEIGPSVLVPGREEESFFQ